MSDILLQISGFIKDTPKKARIVIITPLLIAMLFFDLCPLTNQSFLYIPIPIYQLGCMYFLVCWMSISYVGEKSSKYQDPTNYVKLFTTKLDFYYVSFGVLGAGLTFSDVALNNVSHPVSVVAKFILFFAISLRGAKSWLDIMEAKRPLKVTEDNSAPAKQNKY